MKLLILSIVILFSILTYASDIAYFPKGKFDYISELDNSSIEWHSLHLAELKEPSLWEISKKSDDEIYRFIQYNKSERICIRVEIKQTGDAVAYIKSYLYDDETKIIETIKKIPRKEIRDIKCKLKKLDFWKIKTTDFPGYAGKDNKKTFSVVIVGKLWFFEGINKGKYQVFEIKNADQPEFSSNDMVKLGNSFLQLETLPDTIIQKSWGIPYSE